MKPLYWVAMGAICAEIVRKWVQEVRNDRILSETEQIGPLERRNRRRQPPLRLVQGGNRE